MNGDATVVKVKVDEEKAQELKELYKNFQGKFAESQANFQNSTFATYYIVSSKFIEQWREFCLSNDEERFQPTPMNIDLMDPATQELRAGLVESQDFQLVNTEIYQLFDEYKATSANTLKRISYDLNGQKRVPIYLDKIQYLLVKQSTLESIDRKKITKDDLKFSIMDKVSMNNTVGDFLSVLKDEEGLPGKYTIRGWLNKKQETLYNLHSYIAKETAPLSYWDMKIRGRGKLLEQEEKPLNEIGMEQGDYIIVECAEWEKWFLRSADESKCEGCFKIKKIVITCGCKKVGYCSVECQEKDIQYHEKYCSFMQEQELNKKIEMIMTPKSAKGLVGLSNLGNTCFMNSCLQCLSHTLPLTEYFLSGKFQDEINKINPLGTQGKLAKSYATFIKNMWCEEAKTYSPFRLKAAVASINQMFSGYAQHDSQEFFSFLVDGLHEDLNRIEKKPYIESVDSKGRPDQIVALESWLAHVQRNQSIIVDLMTGQYKSKVVCPDCKKQSITFDPFITVTLPIPEQATVNELSYYVVFNNHEKETKKMSIVYRKADPEGWLKEAVGLLNQNESAFKFYIMTFSENIYDFETVGKNELLYKIESERKSVFLLELSPEEQECKNELEIVARFSKKIYGDSWESMWFKRPFWFKKEGTTGLTVYKRILKYLFYDAYDHSQKRHRGEGQPKTYEEYEKIMLESRPFTLNLRYKKTIERHYHRVDTVFQKQQPIPDQKSIVQLCNDLNITDPDDWELDIKFSKMGLQPFTIDRFKKYQEGERQKKNQYYEEKVTVSLDQCFQVFEEPEQLDKGNEWYCSDCKEHKLATKELTIYKAPEILILHLKRFKSKGILRKEKNDTNVQFPQILDLSKYVIDPLPINSYISEVKNSEKYLEPKHELELTKFNEQPRYELYAVSNHYGGLGGGHYTAYGKNSGKWYSFNDSSVSAVDENSIKGSGAYILFYKRIQ